MGRKRLMTMLAAVVAVASLQAAPAAADSLGLPGVGEVSVEADDGIEVEADLDVEVTEEVKLDPKLKAKVDEEPTAEADGGAKVGDTEIDLAAPEAPAPAPEAPAPAPAPSPDGDQPADDDAAAKDDGDTSASEADRERAERRVQAAGDGAEWTPRRQAQLEAFRALRDHDAAFASASGSSVVPGVELAPRRAAAFGSGTTDEGAAVEQPQVAPGVSAAQASPQNQPTVVAATPATVPGPEVPLPLQVLAAVLVAGAAMSWNLTRRELGWAFSGLRRP